MIGSSAGGQLAGLLMTGAVLSIETGVVDPPRPDLRSWRTPWPIWICFPRRRSRGCWAS